MELVLEQTQQGSSYEVSVSAEGVEELKRKVKIKGEKKEALLTLRQKPGQYICYQQHLSCCLVLKIVIMDPVMRCTTLPSHSKSERLCFKTHGDYTHFYRLSHSELVGIEKVAISSSLRSLKSNVHYRSDTDVITMTMEILLEPTSNKLLVDSILVAGNPVKEILLNLNLPDHSNNVLKLKNIKKDGYTRFQHQEQYEHVGSKVTSAQEGKRSQDDDKRLYLADDLKKLKDNIHVKSKIQVKALI
ncbi:hypothetical protein Tco_1169552 [Tanacetum coccineum]